MRRHYLLWSIAVFGIIGTAYGAYLLVYHFNHGNGLSIPALLLLIFGFIALVTFLAMYIFSYIAEKKKKKESAPIAIEKETEEVTVAEEIEEKPSIKQETKQEREEYDSKSNVTYEFSSSSSYSVSTIYVKQVSYGPLLRIEGSRIVDMRTNTYYRIENNMVMQDGYGPVFEIRGNQIKDAFGGYLYELSGSNINKTFGGFYASISGNYITLYDSSMKYETTDSLSKRQILVVVALLFGK